MILPQDKLPKTDGGDSSGNSRVRRR